VCQSCIVSLDNPCLAGADGIVMTSATAVCIVADMWMCVQVLRAVLCLHFVHIRLYNLEQ